MGTQDLQPVRKDDVWGFKDASGKLVIEPQFESAGGFSEGLARVRVAGKWGFVDVRGEIVISPRFEQARFFSGGTAKVKEDGRWGLIDRNGNWVEGIDADRFVDKEGRFVSEQEYRDWGKPPGSRSS